MPKETLTINFLDNSLLEVNYHDYEDIKDYANDFNVAYGNAPSLYVIECGSQDEYDGFMKAINLTQLTANADPRMLTYVLVSDAECNQFREFANAIADQWS